MSIITLNQLVRDHILAGGPDIASEQDWTDQNHYEAACAEYIDEQLNEMTNVELLERISEALTELQKPYDRRVWP